MNTAAEVDALVEQMKAEHVPLSEAVFRTGVACVGWPYVYGARGGKTTKDGKTVRQFDCRGFTYWCLLQFGIKIMGVGCTSQWNDDSNWEAKGAIADGMPDDVLVCLFYRKKDEPAKMAHTGLGYMGETVECSSGVQFSKTRNKKWTYWAVPKGISDVPIPTPTPAPEPTHPTLRLGAKGEAVKEMQEKLLKAGEKLPKYGADGAFGKETLAAVRPFQRSHGLQVDGICGPKTWAELDKV